jgi:hypothetical protein
MIFGNWLWPLRRRQLFSAASASLKIMASAAARDLNSPIKAHQTNLQRSLIGSEYQPIRNGSQRFWVLR